MEREPEAVLRALSAERDAVDSDHFVSKAAH